MSCSAMFLFTIKRLLVVAHAKQCETNLRPVATIADCGTLTLLKATLCGLDVVDMDMYGLSNELLANKLDRKILAL